VFDAFVFEFCCKDTHFPTIPHTFSKLFFLSCCRTLLITLVSVRYLHAQNAVSMAHSAYYQEAALAVDNFFAAVTKWWGKIRL